MPGKVAVKVKAGRNLPVMDRSNDTTDAYVELKLGNVTHKTDVCRKSLNPQWNADWFRFEVDDSDLQDEPLQIRLMDHDTYSANDAIGKVYINLNPLCLETTNPLYQGKGAVMSGWIPVFDTIHGIRGEVNVIVKVDLFSDANKFRQSSCGVQFFHSPNVPHGYRAQMIHGFVEELVVNDDPEYQWIDKIRTPRASNEARQVLFLKLSRQVQRKIGLKAINLGANAVLGYIQCFDLEGDVGVVARGIGTAVTIVKTQESIQQPSTIDNVLIEDTENREYRSIYNYDTYDENLNNIVSKTLRLIPPDSCITKSPNIILNRKWRPTLKDIIFEESQSDSESMKYLHKQEAMRIISKKRPIQYHVKQITNSSRNRLQKELNIFKMKLNKNRNEIKKTSDSYSLSDITFGYSTRNSLLDLKSYFIKNKNAKFRRTSSCGCGMSAVLISSVMNASSYNSLSKIHNNELGLLDKREMELKKFNSENLSTSTSMSSDISDEELSNNNSDKTVSLSEFNFADTVEQSILEQLNIENTSLIKQIDDENNPNDNIIKASIISQHLSTSDEVNETFTSKSSINNTEETTFQNVNITERSTNLVQENIPEKIKNNQELIDRIENIDNESKFNICELNQRSKNKNDFQWKRKSVGNRFSKFASKIKTAFGSKKSRTNNNIKEYKKSIAKNEINTIKNYSNENEDSSKNDSSVPTISLTYFDDNSESLKNDQIYYSSVPELNQCKYFETTSESNQFTFISLKNLNLYFDNYQQSSTKSLLSSNHVYQSQHISTLNINKNFNLNRNHILSSSNINLNTNTSLLAPFPPQKHHRSELGTSKTPSPIFKNHGGHVRTESVCSKVTQSINIDETAQNNDVLTNLKENSLHRRSSDSDLSIIPKGNSLGIASERLVAATTSMRINANINSKPPLTQEKFEMLEYPFLTMTTYPPGFILHLGATVAARSVKLLERVPNPDEPETRDTWWTELRMEIRSHARAVGCNVVLGYSEVTTISDDVCVLSATGTAAVINMAYTIEASYLDFSGTTKKEIPVSSLDEKDCFKEPRLNNKIFESNEKDSIKCLSSSVGGIGTKNSRISKNYGCVLSHIPYNISSVPFNVKLSNCAICKRAKVPDVLMTTIEIPENLLITGKGCFLQAQVVRYKKDLRSEVNAKEISDGLPFLEYELHRLLINKLKAKGMNGIFGLKVQITIGERMMALIATGTAIFLTALPQPVAPKIVAGNSWTDTTKLKELEKSLNDTIERNREIYQLKNIEINNLDKNSDTEDSDDDQNEIDFATGNKDAYILEVDDIEDLEIIKHLMEPYPPEGYHVVNTQIIPGLHDLEIVKNIQMFVQIWRAKLTVGQNPGNFPKHFQRLLQTIYFKLRSMTPCALCNLNFRLDLPESDEIQILLTGMALGLNESLKHIKAKNKFTLNNTTTDNLITANGIENFNKKGQDDELIFSLDEDQANDNISNNFGINSMKTKKSSSPTSKLKTSRSSKLISMQERYGVNITPLSYVPGGKIEKYLGNLNFFFIRESSSIRENGGISGFMHSFITELLAIMRAHVSALGGNAMVSFYMTELLLVDNQHKNQGQCLISIGGDVVNVSYYSTE